uniref:Reverse transcriptase domain-containing protein n=1 Tax=Vitrella brassicaformis TaxID=1169539 RepID=A0A7S1JMB8_9ALVE|mmetsp:Transcript_14730/g.35124  ORF Transcript_14730/g.35124 Transcript_14730/m.35124 type:complete len:133 (+) Transcript_14730:17-415(+)
MALTRRGVASATLWYRMEDGHIETILSQEGTQQGDAAGPFLFCLGLHPALVKLQEEFLDDFIGAFMDDIYGGVYETRVTRYVDRAEQLLAEKKLKLRRDKSAAWSPHWRQPCDVPAEIAASGVKCSAEGFRV